MNAPLNHAQVQNRQESQLRLFAAFHLNLAFSSIEEDRRGEVIKRCYWPLLELAAQHPGIGIELSAYTLEEIQRLDPLWVLNARQLIASKHIELIGSGFCQLIGPLVPERVVRENLRIAHEIYQGLLGTQPAIALVNEQAFSAGLVNHYIDAGYQAILMDWENPSAHKPDWNPELQYFPQYATGLGGERIALLWSNTTAFQQMQRLVHGDITIETYLRFLRQRQTNATRTLCIYASDAEIFDFRPGRFRTEEKLADTSEWTRWNEALLTIQAQPGMTLVRPSEALELMEERGAAHILELQSAACPVPVKKQAKYNLARWAVSGRDNTAINAACERIYHAMTRSAQPDWKELCYLWSSDFRTHLTEKRWMAFCERLGAAEAQWSNRFALPETAQEPTPLTDRHISIETPTLSAQLDRRRGLAIEWLRFSNQRHPVLGGLPHGYFDGIALQADWYTGDSVFEAPGEHKVTDLEWAEAWIDRLPSGDVIVTASIQTPKGLIEKQMTFSATEKRIDFDLTFHWEDWGKGILRLGHFTLLPEAYALDRLSLTTTNGGGPETYQVDTAINHGAPVSALVSSSHGFGMTEGWAEIGDDTTRLRIEIDRTVAPLLGLLTHTPAKRPDGSASVFCQIQLSALELDDTRKPSSYRKGPRSFSFSVKGL